MCPLLPVPICWGERSPAGNRKIPRYFSTPADCSVDREWSTALIPRVKPSCRSQPHAGTPHTPGARGLWDTGSLRIQADQFSSARAGWCWAGALASDVIQLGEVMSLWSEAKAEQVLGVHGWGAKRVMISHLLSHAFSPDSLLEVAGTSKSTNNLNAAHDSNDPLHTL